jgi:hypothetical protein
MSFKDGFYKVHFSTPVGSGAGVAYVLDGKIHGGDSSMAYVGKFTVGADQVSAEVRVFTHTVGLPSVLGVPLANLKLAGLATDSQATLTGEAAEAPGLKITLNLSHID